MQKLIGFFKFSASGIAISFFMLFVIFANKKYMPYELFLREAIPFYKTNFSFAFLFQNESGHDLSMQKVFKNESMPMKIISSPEIFTDIINENNVEYQKDAVNSSLPANENLDIDFQKLRDITYLKKEFYVSDKKTNITSEDFNVDKFLAVDTTINNGCNGPKIIIFHTHSTEMFKDSNESDIYEGVVGLGKKLAQILNDKYNIKTLHHTKRYDIIGMKPDKRGAYERMESEVMKLINDNPSIQVAIDIHRDGVDESVHLVENVNGKPTAKIMFVDGLCKLLKNNYLIPIDNLSNPYLETNLALSFKMQMKCYNLYPNLVRKIYVNAYRYSLNMLPKSLLIEVGAQTNTKQEALNAIEPLADVLSKVLLEK